MVTFVAQVCETASGHLDANEISRKLKLRPAKPPFIKVAGRGRKKIQEPSDAGEYTGCSFRRDQVLSIFSMTRERIAVFEKEKTLLFFKHDNLFLICDCSIMIFLLGILKIYEGFDDEPQNLL